MRISSWLLFPAIALATACGKSGDRAAEAPGADTSVASGPAAAGPKTIVTVLYNAPKDTAAFERYYANTHLPLVVANQKEIGFVRADLTKFVSTADGKKPTYYRQAELYFPSMDALKTGTATAAFKEVAGDLPKFATGGFDALVGAETK
jgi:uncharacterized protein (TIGR02118 family)